MWRNWQTRCVQGAVGIGPWGFESLHRHSETPFSTGFFVARGLPLSRTGDYATIFPTTSFPHLQKKPILMARQTAPQKQLLTLRQGAIFLAILILSIFAYKYAQNVMRIRSAQMELARLAQEIDKVKQQQALATESINGLNAAQVDSFAKGELGWAQQGETIYIPFQTASATGPDEGDHAISDVATPKDVEAPPPNWRLWLALLTD